MGILKRSKGDDPVCLGKKDRESHHLVYEGTRQKPNGLYHVWRCARTGCYKEFLEKVKDKK